jgi:hypothetical protein
VPPAEFPRGFATDDDEDEMQTALDVDFFEYKKLSEDLLSTDELFSSSLDVNRLNNTFLDDLLNLSDVFLGNELDEMENSVLPNIRNFPWIQAAVNEEYILLDSERPPHIAMLVAGVDTQGTYNLTQDGVSAAVQINEGGTDVTIRIVQTQ